MTQSYKTTFGVLGEKYKGKKTYGDVTPPSQQTSTDHVIYIQADTCSTDVIMLDI